ncbi:MAG: M20/M25/M40 family metallo-hydrolase [Ignavibacterium sp.]|nr:M20/M25/M40 family metallo-hydrolase [Ignavibacterium sp.]
MKRSIVHLLLIIIFSYSLLAQTDQKFLISIDLSKASDLNKVELAQIPVYHLFDNILISAVTQQKLFILQELTSDLTVLDEMDEFSSYYIITPSVKKEQSHDLTLFDPVYIHGNQAIIKKPLEIERIISMDYSIAEIKETNSLFKNERLINSRAISYIDTVIANIVALVNPDSVGYFIQSLQDFQTRFLFANTRDSVASWIQSQFISFGFTDVRLDSFQYQGTWQTNVVATITGNVYPEKVFVFGGHHDSYSSGDPMIFAPGADDNASGTAAALEVARIIMQSGYQPKSTIKFITFAAEEYGLWGSKHYAEYALNQGMDIKLMINHDMISHDTSPLHLGTVDINRYTQGSEVWSDMAMDMVNLYSVLTPYIGSTNSSSSDSYSFWQRGFDVVYFEERDFSPYYHSPQDVISNYNMPYCAEVIKSSGALLLTAIKIPSVIENYFLYDIGNGTSLNLKWAPNLDPDFANYKIYIGLNSGNYFQTFVTSDTSHIIENLTEGTKYYVAVSSVSSDGSESFLTERSMTPYSVPLAPQNLIAIPKWHAVYLSWGKNIELDFAGYNLYRSIESSGNYIKLNSQLLTDTLFSDISISPGIKYYYYVKAQDTDDNESERSNLVASRAVTLDRGILLVDATADGNGSLLNPTDFEVDEFYDSILSDFIKSDYEINSEGDISLMELAPYSTVIWQKDDNQNTIYSIHDINVIKDYLDYGGNLLFVGHRPARVFGGSTSGSGNYNTGSFLYDYLKIDSSLYRNAARFQGGVSLTEFYSDIFTDSTKTNPSLNYHLLGIESIVPAQNANAIYKYETQYDSSSSFGSMKNEPVGVEYIGSDYKAITLSFPLYYMIEEQSKVFIDNILISKFNEVTEIESENEIKFAPTGFVLEQNYPNPFNPVTKISYVLPSVAMVDLQIYNVLGQLITTLVNEEKPKGFYEVNFNATELPSGIYMYRLKAGDFMQTKKMIFLK